MTKLIFELIVQDYYNSKEQLTENQKRENKKKRTKKTDKSRGVTLINYKLSISKALSVTLRVSLHAYYSSSAKST